MPYNERDIRSIYHVREYDVHKLMQVEEPIDIFLSHDWPVGITDHGDWQALVRRKPFFNQEVIKRFDFCINMVKACRGNCNIPAYFSTYFPKNV